MACFIRAIFLEQDEDEWVNRIFYAGIVDFFETHITGWMEKYPKTDLNFVGSIAFELKYEIQMVCEQKRYELGKIIKTPIEDLTERYLIMDRT